METLQRWRVLVEGEGVVRLTHTQFAEALTGVRPSARIALIEPYLGGSHRAWAEGYAERSAHQVEVFGLNQSSKIRYDAERDSLIFDQNLTIEDEAASGPCGCSVVAATMCPGFLRSPLRERSQ